MNVDKGEISGFPLRGIVENFRNPFIVLMYFVDFLFQKGNKNLSRQPLLYSVAELICSVNKRLLSSQKNRKDHLPSNHKNKGLKVSRFYLSRGRLIQRLSPFYIFVRYRLGMCTYDDLRQFICNVLPDSIITPPSTDRQMKFEFDTLFLLAISSVGEDVKKRLNTYMDRLLQPNVDLVVKDNLSHPIMLTLENHFIRLKLVLQNIAKRYVTVEETLKELILFDPDMFLKEPRGRVIKE